MVAVGVEWAERSDEPDPYAVIRSDRRNRPGPVDLNADQDPDSAAARPAGRDISPALADPERRAIEYHRYRALVERAFGANRGAGPSRPDTPSGADERPGTEAPAAGDDPAGRWDAAVPELRDAWEKIKDKYGHAERSGPLPQPADGSWRGEGGRKLDAAQNAEIDRGCARIREAGERIIIPGIQAVEAQDPTRRLAGFEHRFKGTDRLKEKAADEIRSTPGITPAQALSAIPDAVRSTYQYEDTAYTAGVRKDVERLEERGFIQVERRNTWTSDQYRGINSRWREPGSGVVFEVQFHTRASLEAKELTHKAYERIRSITEQTPETERETAELKEFQRQVNARVPIPPGVTEYEDYRPERRNGRRD
jgi:hypothetical protein